MIFLGCCLSRSWCPNGYHNYRKIRYRSIYQPLLSLISLDLGSRADLDPDQVNVKCAEKVKRAASAAAAAASAYEAIADGPLASRDLNALLTRDNGADVYVAKAKRAAEAAAAAAEEANEAIAAEIEIKKL